MYNQRRSSNGAASIFGSITSFLSKGWDTINAPTDARCTAYTAQADFARSKMESDDISRRDRRYWSRQQDKAMNGLADVHQKNSDTMVGVACAVGAGALILLKLLKK